MSETLGKKAEKKIWEWLDRPEDGYSFTRLYDQLSGYYLTSRNICDFICYKYPYIYYIESKATEADRFPFSYIQPHQHDGLLTKSKIPGCYGLVIILFATYRRAFVIDIRTIDMLSQAGTSSINIKTISKWNFPYKELRTIDSRKMLLDYSGEIEEFISELGEV